MKDSLSSPWTPALKLFPVAFWLFCLGLALYSWLTKHPETDFRIGMALFVLPFMVLMFIRYRRLLDHVEIVGDRLFMRRHGEEQRVPLSEVIDVRRLSLGIPSIVSLRLRKPGPFGEEVRFAARLAGANRWGTRLLATESLIAAVDAAKSGAKT